MLSGVYSMDNLIYVSPSDDGARYVTGHDSFLDVAYAPVATCFPTKLLHRASSKVSLFNPFISPDNQFRTQFPFLGIP